MKKGNKNVRSVMLKWKRLKQVASIARTNLQKTLEQFASDKALYKKVKKAARETRKSMRNAQEIDAKSQENLKKIERKLKKLANGSRGKKVRQTRARRRPSRSVQTT